MKFRTTLILLAVFCVLLAFVFLLEKKGKNGEASEDRLINLDSDDVGSIVYVSRDQVITFQKEDSERWKIIDPLGADADRYEVNRLVDDISDATIERIVEETPENLEKYGFPNKELRFYQEDREAPITILIGMKNPLDETFYAKRAEETRIVLLPSSLNALLDKKLFDFRKKDIFEFETDNAEYIEFSSATTQWRASKTEKRWFLQEPVKSLAANSKINSLLNLLSSLKAIEFTSEEKNKEEMDTYGLVDPDFSITLSFSDMDQPLVMAINKTESEVFATTSSSSKIIKIEESLLSDIEISAEDLREKRIAALFSWQINKIEIQSDQFEINVTKDKEGGWHFGSAAQEEANKEKIQTFIRKIEGLEAEEFIDPPYVLEDLGLDNPQKRVTIWERDEENVKEITILIGTEDAETKKTVVKNADLDYLFRVDSSFLELFPKNIEEWEVKEEGN